MFPVILLFGFVAVSTFFVLFAAACFFILRICAVYLAQYTDLWLCVFMCGSMELYEEGYFFVY